METTNTTSVGNVMSARVIGTNGARGMSVKMNVEKNVMSVTMTGANGARDTSVRMNAGNGMNARESAMKVGNGTKIGIKIGMKTGSARTAG
jgi:hypothetical protein